MTRVNLSMLRALCGQGFPNESSTSRFYNMKQTKNMFKISLEMHTNMRKVVRVWSKHWPVLNAEHLLKYDKYFINVLRNKVDIAGGQIERIFLKNDVFYKKMANEQLHNEVFVYLLLERRFPKLVEFIPKLLGLACADRIEPYIEFQRKQSISKFSEQNLKRIENFNYGQLKPKKRKKVSYLDRVKSINDNNRQLFNQLKQLHQNPSEFTYFVPILPKKGFAVKCPELNEQDNFIIKNLDILQQFRDFPELPQIWQFMESFERGKNCEFAEAFPELTLHVRKRIIKGNKKQFLQTLSSGLKYYLALENVLEDDSYSILDTKLTLLKFDRKFLLTDPQHRLKCSNNDRTMKMIGLIIKSASGRVLLSLKKGCSYLDYDIQRRLIRRLFEFEPNKLDLAALEYSIGFLERLRGVLEEYQLTPVSSSILILYSPRHRRVLVKMVDFANMPRRMDGQKGILGLIVLIGCLKEIKKGI